MSDLVESVWDYPRPPRLEPVSARLRVILGETVVADTVRGMRLLETSHPPVYYIPPDDITPGTMVSVPGSSFCEFKGAARYWDVQADGRTARRAAWSYPEPSGPYAALRDHYAFYASRVTACFVGEEQVTAQEGDFYGGWITSAVRGPFKGPPGTRFW